MVIGVVPTMRGGTDIVTISSTAAPDYHREWPDGSLRPESYVFTPGLHSGATRDTTQEAAGLNRVLQRLAPALARREYWPTKDADQADLLIVVNWGETMVYTDALAEFTMDRLNSNLAAFSAVAAAQGKEAPDTGSVNSVLSDQFLARQQSASTARHNAQLLGYTATITREERRYFPSEEERTLKTELAEPRYFIVLMAYDFPAMRKRNERRLRWVTRMSVRAPGNNFMVALPHIIDAAEPLFGTQQAGLTRRATRIDERKTEVQLGDAVVVEDPPLAPPPD